MKAELKLDGIQFGYDSKQLINVNHCVFSSGEIVWLKGENGSGKTTLMRLLAGLLSPSSGRLNLKDQQGNVLSAKQRQERIVYLHPTPYLFDMSVIKNLKLFSRSSHPVALKQALSLFSLDDIQHWHVKKLSAGQQQRLALARAWLKKPLFLLLDETLVHLDQQKLGMINGLLQQMVDDGCCIISCSHQADAVTFGNSREITIKNGSLYELPTSVEAQTYG
ncbi:Spermidine/putrescine import ATP-binding protein PotA [Sinobacterium norvegicum]|uniref:Spermidine/putrescine import ATP-binding protein PotA n=1 Tax=Sinobacterium norvegicum TaxID=1641715 RepID=A0ABM9AHP8_9GAMM|nr:ATP-binding cassette domain-containing protein [Sinobacterium norvegicum]CAH0992752.1 Spermidine/putrescine import ATP-binding protein PotA [Sinobacterium norvegicum]